MKSCMIIFIIFFVSAFFFCGAVSAASVQSTHNTTAKISNVGTLYSFKDSSAIDGNRVVWIQTTSGHSVVYTKNLKTGKTIKILATKQTQYDPAISGTRVVWLQAVSSIKTFIYEKNLATGS